MTDLDECLIQYLKIEARTALQIADLMRVTKMTAYKMVERIGRLYKLEKTEIRAGTRGPSATAYRVISRKKR